MTRTKNVVFPASQADTFNARSRCAHSIVQNFNGDEEELDLMMVNNFAQRGCQVSIVFHHQKQNALDMISFQGDNPVKAGKPQIGTGSARSLKGIRGFMRKERSLVARTGRYSRELVDDRNIRQAHPEPSASHSWAIAPLKNKYPISNNGPEFKDGAEPHLGTNLFGQGDLFRRLVASNSHFALYIGPGEVHRGRLAFCR